MKRVILPFPAQRELARQLAPAAGARVGQLEWRWWKRARALHLLLLAAIASSFAAALLTTNNYGGEAVGFRHAV